VDVQLAISEINYALRGIDDDAPIDGSDEWNYWVSVLNRVKRTVFRDVKQNWSESFEVRSIGTVTASASLTFNLPTDFLAPSGDGDFVGAFVVTTDGTRVDLDLVKPQQSSSRERQVYIAGVNPQVLHFSFEVTADDQIVGGELFLPGYYMPADVADANDSLVFPDNDWGVMAAAAEIAFNDIVYETKSPDLNAKANAMYLDMVSRNQRGFTGQPRKAVYNVKRITG
jgi:hypothetical protein